MHPVRDARRTVSLSRTQEARHAGGPPNSDRDLAELGVRPDSGRNHANLGPRSQSRPQSSQIPRIQGLVIVRIACPTACRQRVRGEGAHGVRMRRNATYHLRECYATFPFVCNSCASRLRSTLPPSRPPRRSASLEDSNQITVRIWPIYSRQRCDHWRPQIGPILAEIQPRTICVVHPLGFKGWL